MESQTLDLTPFHADNSVVMSPVRFGVQAAVVLTLLVLVTWPETRQLRGASSVWRTGGPLAGLRFGGDAARSTRRGERARPEVGYGSAGLENASIVGSNPLQRKLDDNGIERRRRTPAAVAALGGRINAIIGRARTSLNAAVPFARILLRNVVTGLVEARATADEKGEFTFLDVVPSGYVVELLGADGSVLATSELLNVDVGELRETTVRLSAARSMLAAFGILGPTAGEPVRVAINEGVNAVTQPANTVSPQR